jgi:hypothetical protein
MNPKETLINLFAALAITVIAQPIAQAYAAPMHTAECSSDISECYSAMQRACPKGFQIADRNSFYGDGLVRELPPGTLFLASQYNQYLYSCQ